MKDARLFVGLIEALALFALLAVRVVAKVKKPKTQLELARNEPARWRN